MTLLEHKVLAALNARDVMTSDELADFLKVSWGEVAVALLSLRDKRRVNGNCDADVEQWWALIRP